MTTNTIISISRKKILEETNDLVSDETLLIYANLAYKSVIKKSFVNGEIQTATITFTGGVGTLPVDFGTLYTDAYDVSKNIYPEVSISDFIRQDGQQAITIEGGALKVSPTSVTSLIIKYYPVYAELTTVVNPTIDEYLHESIVYGIIYRAYEDLQDPELSVYYKTKFDEMLAEKLADISNYEEDAQRGNVMFNGINVIGDNQVF